MRREKVESDTGYYGFNAIPPFQTGLGQILALKSYDKNNLPEQFIHEKIFSSKGPVSEGYIEYGGRGFGYYTSLNSFLSAKESYNFSVNDLYSFFWNGRDNQSSDTTSSSREKLSTVQASQKQTAEWEIAQIGIFNYKFPKGFLFTKNKQQLENRVEYQEISNSSKTISVSLYMKDKTIPFHEYLVNVKDTDGKVIQQDRRIINITRTNGTQMTVIVVSTSTGDEYYIPSTTGEYYVLLKEVSTIENDQPKEIDEVIKTMYQN